MIKQSTKKYIIVLAIAVFIIAIAIAGSGRDHRMHPSRDAKRESDIRQISVACELYYSDIDKYPVYTDFAALREGGIGNYMKVDYMGSSVPDDPLGGDVHYLWIDNTGVDEDQHFCVYAKLKSVSVDTWFVGSEKGYNYKETREPTGLGDACW
jgi:hypothetical protein